MPKKNSTHWAAVTAEISRRTGKSFIESKKIYDVIKASQGAVSTGWIRNRKQSVLNGYAGAAARAQRKLEEELRRRVEEAERRKEAARKEAERRARQAERERRKQALAEKLGIKLAPKPQERPPGEPVPLPPLPRTPAQRKRMTRFHKLCVKYKVPYPAPGEMRSFINSQWRDVKWQTRLAKALAGAYRSIKTRGYVSDKWREILKRVLLQRLPEDKATGFWFGLLRQLYR
jgi:hypothetical protein